MANCVNRLFKSSVANQVCYSPDRGRTWCNAHHSGGILLVVPGAGVATSLSEFCLLRDVCKAEGSPYNEYGDAHSKNYSEYPCNWHSPGLLRLPDDQDDCDGGLMRLAWQIRQDILTGVVAPPALIVAGGHGGQVVLSLLLADCWQGAILSINASVLTVECPMPKLSPFVGISFGKDYLQTHNPAYSQQRYRRAGGRHGWLLHCPNLAHESPLPLRLLFIASILAVTNRTPDQCNLTTALDHQVCVYSM